MPYFSEDFTKTIKSMMAKERVNESEEVLDESIFELEEGRMIPPRDAKDILDQAGGADKDFFELPSHHVSTLLQHMKEQKFKRRKDHPGSTVRMFHQHLKRRAASVKEDFEDEGVILSEIAQLKEAVGSLETRLQAIRDKREKEKDEYDFSDLDKKEQEQGRTVHKGKYGIASVSDEPVKQDLAEPVAKRRGRPRKNPV